MALEAYRRICAHDHWWDRQRAPGYRPVSQGHADGWVCIRGPQRRCERHLRNTKRTSRGLTVKGNGALTRIRGTSLPVKSTLRKIYFCTALAALVLAIKFVRKNLLGLSTFIAAADEGFQVFELIESRTMLRGGRNLWHFRLLSWGLSIHPLGRRGIWQDATIL